MTDQPRQTLRVLVPPDPDPWLDLAIDAAAEVLRARGVRVVIERRTRSASDTIFDPLIGPRGPALEVKSEGTLDAARATRALDDWQLACAAIYAYLEAIARRTSETRN